MVAFQSLLKSVLLAVTYASVASAVPSTPGAKHATHRVRTVGRRGLQVETFAPETTYETFGAGVDHPLTKRQDASLKETTVAFVEEKLGVDASAVQFKSGHSGDSGEFGYARQQHDGIPFANSVANVAFKNNRVVAFGSSFVKTDKIASKKPSISVEKAITVAEAALDGTYNKSPAKLEYFVKQDKSVVLTHVVEIQNEKDFTWYEAFVDAHTGELVSVVDFVADATYRVLPIQKEYPTEGFEDLADPQDSISSPSGWHSDGTTTTTKTLGNNVNAYKSSTSTGQTSESSAGNYLYTFDSTQAPTADVNIKAATVNAFYIVNTLHDLYYRYGFTEAAYNFQTNNFGKGGKGNDLVQVSVQDSSGTNNANFATPADGSVGQMRMYVWTYTTPRRDGDLENDIITHEMTHGLTNRLTGGGTGRCLQTTEAGGMGEGWSDAMAEWTELKSANITDYALGEYVYLKNIRRYPYSTSAATNPLRYSSVASNNEVHNIGEIWANMLHNVLAALVAAKGYSATARTNPDGTEGNIVHLHLFIDALKLQPCNPTFVQARDAWIQADVNRYGGANKCLLWKAFASRGLGVGAASYKDSTAVPSDC